MQIHPVPLKDVAAVLHARFTGDPSLPVKGFNEIHRVAEGDCAFVDHPKYYDKVLNSRATVIIINKEVECPKGKGLIIHDEPFTAFKKLTEHFHQRTFSKHQVSTSARLGEGCTVMSGVFIGDNVVTGKNCVFHPNVVIYDNCVIGDNVIIHANSTIGGDAFYFRKRANNYEPMYSCGNVEIGDDVIIGSNCSVDRGATHTTRIGRGTRIDNLVQVGHDVIIGEMCLFAAQVGIAGACTIGNKVTIWGQAGISSGITIGDGATVLAQSGVGEDIPAGKTFFGSPAGDSRHKMRELFALKQLPDLISKLYKKG
jgi:UDP-3-O-[3-hydroxymyristoyl] glucosamine N-acyltransferase